MGLAKACTSVSIGREPSAEILKALPTSFFERDVCAFPEGFDPMELALGDFHIAVIPESRPALLGENRVQEFLSKKDEYDKTADVHFIGHLQTNKVKYIINDVKMIQSVDSIKLAEEINRLAKANNKTIDILIEINIGGELSKSGIDKNELENLLYKVSTLESDKVKGLMTIPPVNAPESLYENMQKLFVDIRDKKIDNINMSVLSMGMSNDYQTAIKYGSNLVRIGTGLFGARNYNGG